MSCSLSLFLKTESPSSCTQWSVNQSFIFPGYAFQLNKLARSVDTISPSQSGVWGSFGFMDWRIATKVFIAAAVINAAYVSMLVFWYAA